MTDGCVPKTSLGAVATLLSRYELNHARIQVLALSFLFVCYRGRPVPGGRSALGMSALALGHGTRLALDDRTHSAPSTPTVLRRIAGGAEFLISGPRPLLNGIAFHKLRCGALDF